MTSALSQPHSGGGKRGACDRCRGQKLRCLRADVSQNSPQAECVRCFRAGATCNFGIQKRAGRLPASNDPPRKERRGNGKKSGMASRAIVSPSAHGSLINSKGNGGQGQRRIGERGSDWSVEENTAEQENEGESEDTIPVHAVNPSSAHETSSILPGYNLDFSTRSGSSSATLPWPDETLPTFYNNDAGEASGLESFDPEYGWAFQHYQAQPMDIQIPIAPGQVVRTNNFERWVSRQMERVHRHGQPICRYLGLQTRQWILIYRVEAPMQHLSSTQRL